MANWKTLSSEAGVHMTFCCECGATHFDVGLEALASNGAPMCTDCDEEMTLFAVSVDTDRIKG